jgi:O-antigen/teichoic acid export membrane protein
MPSVARSSLWLFGARAAGVAIGFLAVVVFAREIGVAALGSYFLFQALLTVVSLGTDLGLRSATEKRVSEGQPAGEVLGTVLALKGGLLGVGALVVLALRAPIATFVGADLAAAVVVAAALRDTGLLTTFVLRGELRVRASATVEFVRKATFGVVGVALVVQGYGVRGPVYGVIAGYAAMTLVGAARMATRPGRPSRAMARSLLEYGRYKFVSNVGTIGYSWIDVLVIGAFLSPAAVGAYEIAWKIASIVTVFSDALATTAFPQLSKEAGQGALDRVEATFTRLVTPSLALVVPAFFGTVVLAADILGIVFGPAYVAASLALVVLLADSVSTAVYRFVTRTLRALDAPDLDARGVVVSVVLNVVLNLLLVPRFGLVGAAVATTLASLAGEALSLLYLSRVIDVRFEWRTIGWTVVAAGGMAAIVWAVRRQFVVDTELELAALVALGVVAYAAIGLAMPPLRASARDGLAALRRTDGA